LVLRSAFVRKPQAAAVACAAAAALALPATAAAGSGGVGSTDAPPPPVKGSKAKLLPSGQARAPKNAPQEVRDAIAAANAIDDAGYCSGGGHGRWRSACYDCSGAVSYILGPKGAGILDTPEDSRTFARWGERGKGTWITVYTNPGHAYAVIAGLRFDTSIPDDGQQGPGWSKDVKAGLVNGPFQKRHFVGI
jgi:hypothetical protein